MALFLDENPEPKPVKRRKCQRLSADSTLEQRKERHREKMAFKKLMRKL